MKEKNREPWVAQVLLREIHVCTHTHRVFVAYWRDPPSPNCLLRNWLTAGSTQPLLQPFCFILLLTTILESNSIHVQDYMRQSVMRQRQKCLSFDSLRPMDYSSPDLSMEYSGKNTRLGRHFLLQGIFLNHGSNPSLLQCRQILYCLSHQLTCFRGKLHRTAQSSMRSRPLTTAAVWRPCASWSFDDSLVSREG